MSRARCDRCLQPQELLSCGALSLCSACTSRTLQAKKAVRKREKADRPVERVKTSSTSRSFVNDNFNSYYKQQLAFPAAEWATFEQHLRQPLPVTWRFSGDDAAAQALRDDMERCLLPALKDEQPHALGWYPSRLGWQLGVSRAALRGKDWDGADGAGGAGRSAAVKALHTWLLRETELGRVQRQESASMVPPLLLEARPGHTILDMCASPGSKTQQCLELLQGDGLVVANDASTKRSQLLASRVTRLHSTALVVTNHDARLLPEVLHTAGGGTVPLMFDRVLADVPCSGDGTLRKNPIIWKRWSSAPGNSLHALQLQIACKGVRLLKVRAAACGEAACACPT